MEKILIYIKHHLQFLWKIIEWVNDRAFLLMFKNRMQKVLFELLEERSGTSYTYRRLSPYDATALYNLLKAQDKADLEYFSPHGFDLSSIYAQFRKSSFLMMGVFDGDIIVGYFFLRFFINRKCFVGRLIDKNYRGKGIGNIMNNIMYETAWGMGFRCLSTISRDNTAVMRAHSKNQNMKLIKHLQNNYLLIEFVKNI